ncbi:MAG TPA: hypothetical protein VLH35_04385 [Candidatus Acidoferrales bacterium]|nr:hypothetical protein [Candidatus Acidoferrales bacterium]
MVLQTLVYHVSEKTNPEFLVHMPSVSAVYQQISVAVAGRVTPSNVVLMPEYNAHAVWADEAAWLAANFQGIPVMVDAAGGWDPAQFVTPQRLADLLGAGLTVSWIRISELVSYYEEWLHEPFPDAYMASMLQFCKDHGIKVYLCEWKITAFDKILQVIQGFEDNVWVGFKTNSGDMEPAQGFKYLVDKLRASSSYPEHWGATIETWYWETRHRGLAAHDEAKVWEPNNMPISYMVCHAQEAINMPTVWYSGAELIQFEAYWWFFGHTTGKARESLAVLSQFLNSQVACAENSTVVLETLKAEWIGGPAKDKIAWLDGRASSISEYDIQPSKHDFKNMPQEYAVSCYQVSDTGSRWLRTETVAVEILVKVLGSTLQKASFSRERIRVEVERILSLYGRLGPLWDPGTGVLHRRVVPGLTDLVVAGVSGKSDDTKLARVTVLVRCQYLPRKLWVSK